MDILIATKAKDRIGYSGYLLMWTNHNYQEKVTYESIVSWQSFTKAQALDIIHMIVILALLI